MIMKSLGLASLAALLIAVPSWAHHSHANYELNEFLELDATVTQVMWINPHVWLYVDGCGNSSRSPTKRWMPVSTSSAATPL